MRQLGIVWRKKRLVGVSLDRVEPVSESRPMDVDARVAECFILRHVGQANLGEVSGGGDPNVALPVEFVLLDPACIKREIIDGFSSWLQDLFLNGLFNQTVLLYFIL